MTRDVRPPRGRDGQPSRSSRRKSRERTEYALLLVLIAIAVLLAVFFLGPTLTTLFSDVGENLQQ